MSEDIRKKQPKKKPGKIKTVLIVVVGLLCMAFVLLIIFRNEVKRLINHELDKKPMAEEIEDFYNDDLVGEEGHVDETISETNIRKVFEISGLQTADYIYNSVVRVYNEDESEILYYVSYEGTITAGIDFKDIEIETDEENKRIILTIPEVEIQDTIVNAGTLDFIFMKDKYDKEETYNEAYNLCQKDLDEKSKYEEELMINAQENAEQVVKALTSPWIEQLYPEYILEIRKGGGE